MIWKLRIFGEPRPYPGKEVAQRWGYGSMILKGQRAKSTEADKRRLAWFEVVKIKVALHEPSEIISLRTPVKVSGCVYITKPEKSTRKYPSSSRDGDCDNYWYVVHNALEGIVYENDGQIVQVSERIRWANNGTNEDEDPGISIVVEVMN